MGKREEARPLFEEALQACRATLGDRHPSTLTSINNLGLLLHAMGKLEEARPLLEEALQAQRETLGDRHPDTLTSISNFGMALHANKVLDGAQQLYEEIGELADFKKMESIRARVDEVIADSKTADALKPWYRQFCKRPCFHDDYLATFNRESVHLIDTDGKGVEKITEKGVVVGGVEYELDCLIYATGFEVGTSYTRRSGYELHGRDGVSLSDRWADGVESLHGMFVRDFPNVFVMGGAQAAGVLKPRAGGTPQLLGTELWSGEGSVTRASALRGALFSAVSDNRYKRFVDSYEARFGSQPYRIATLGYDAVLLTLRVARDWRVGRDFPDRALRSEDGFLGLDGAFRFGPNGLVERAFEVREVRDGAVVVVENAPARF